MTTLAEAEGLAAHADSIRLRALLRRRAHERAPTMTPAHVRDDLALMEGTTRPRSTSRVG